MPKLNRGSDEREALWKNSSACSLVRICIMRRIVVAKIIGTFRKRLTDPVSLNWERGERVDLSSYDDGFESTQNRTVWQNDRDSLWQ